MGIIIVGVGRLGLSLALALSRQRRQVTVIDRDARALDALPDDFSGRRVVGVGFDRDVLGEAGVESASAVVACTSADETNIVVAHTAKHLFHVPTVIARLYNAEKAETYRRLGIRTVSTTGWGVRSITQLLSYEKVEVIGEVGPGDVSLVRVEVPHLLEGCNVQSVSVPGEVGVVALVRDGRSCVPALGTVLAHGDVVVAVVDGRSLGTFERIWGVGLNLSTEGR